MVANLTHESIRATALGTLTPGQQPARPRRRLAGHRHPGRPVRPRRRHEDRPDRRGRRADRPADRPQVLRRRSLAKVNAHGGRPMTDATVVLVPGLRGHVEDHWQTRLAATLPDVRTVPPLGRTDPSLRARGPACSTGSSRTSTDPWSWSPTAPASWSPCTGRPRTRGRRSSGRSWRRRRPSRPRCRRSTRRSRSSASTAGCRSRGGRCRSPSILAVSSNDPLGNPVRVRALANAWGSRIHVARGRRPPQPRLRVRRLARGDVADRGAAATGPSRPARDAFRPTRPQLVLA